MQIKDIEYVAAIADKKSFSAAAEKLFISQSALSQTIKKLEKELGVTLFNRTTTSVKLTAAGELFLSEGSHLLLLNNQLLQHIKNFSEQTQGKLRIGISTFYSTYYLPKILPQHNNLYPNVQIEIIEGISQKLEEQVLSEDVDFSLIPLPLTKAEALEYTVLHQEQILFAMPHTSPLKTYIKHSLSHKDFPFIDLSNARNESFIFLLPEQRFYKAGLQLCETAGFTPRIQYNLSNWDTINALIGCGVGVGFVPEIVTERKIKNIESPIYCRLINQSATRPYVIVYKKNRQFSPEAENFLSMIKTIFTD